MNIYQMKSLSRFFLLLRVLLKDGKSTLGNIGQVCRRWERIQEEDSLWEPHLKAMNIYSKWLDIPNMKEMSTKEKVRQLPKKLEDPSCYLKFKLVS